MSSRGTTRVVALIGMPGSGKAIVARRLLQDHGFQRLRFTDSQRDMLKAGFGLTDHDIDGPGRDRPDARFGGHTLDNVLRTLSQNWGRGTLHSDVWVNEWRRRVGLATGLILADDMRSPNEALACQQVGGIVVRITRPGWSPNISNTIRQQARLVHDVELINESPEQLEALTDRLAQELVRPAEAEVA